MASERYLYITLFTVLKRIAEPGATCFEKRRAKAQDFAVSAKPFREGSE